jgi:hypothetical protein
VVLHLLPATAWNKPRHPSNKEACTSMARCKKPLVTGGLLDTTLKPVFCNYFDSNKLLQYLPKAGFLLSNSRQGLQLLGRGEVSR